MEKPLVSTQRGVDALLGDSQQMQRVRMLLTQFAPVRHSVLVRGETGTGKELAAQALHADSGRPGNLVPLNCGASSDELAASQLFGHVKGAFTGAHRDYGGAFERATHGTLFLDEVGELSLPQQVMLLRVLETRQVTPVGGHQERSVNARVVAATHRDLEGMVARGEFRQDLYHRLKILVVRLPPLRERREDIPQLMLHFAQRAASELGHPVRVRQPALDAAQQAGWLGNGRELYHAVVRAAIMSHGDISRQDLLDANPTDRLPRARPLRCTPTQETTLDVPSLEQAVAKYGGVNKAARELGIARSTLSAKLRRARKEGTG